MFAVSEIDHYTEEACFQPPQCWTKLPDGTYRSMIHHVIEARFIISDIDDPGSPYPTKGVPQLELRYDGKVISGIYGPGITGFYDRVERWHDKPPVFSIPEDSGLVAKVRGWWRERHPVPQCERPGVAEFMVH